MYYFSEFHLESPDMGVVRSQSAVHVGDSFLRATPRTAPPPPLHVWNVQSGEEVKVIKEDFASSIYSISVSPGGKYFLCEGANYSLHVFEVNSLRLTKTVVKLPGSICSLSFISDTTVIAGVMNSGILAIDITTGVISIIANSLVYAYPAGVAYRNTIPDNMVSVYRNTLTIIMVSTDLN